MSRRLALLLTLLLAPGCAGAAAPVVVDYGGNYVDTTTLPAGAVTLEPATTDGMRTWSLRLSAPAPGIGGRLTVVIVLGATPATGTFSPASVGQWTAAMIATTNCQYGAGSDAVPFGSFELTLDAVPSGDTAGPAHGTLTISQRVHAPPGVDCGPGDDETVRVVF